MGRYKPNSSQRNIFASFGGLKIEKERIGRLGSMIWGNKIRYDANMKREDT
jgi:hypothetical protein